ncbi:MAG TPA: helix-hairpin-helix domain-containing protein [Bacteroidales bacterium]|nr:helix-hairpin-helix domain-containing protein [Bacteroidales bacterium]
MLFPQSLKRWFGYSRRERVGTFILCLILFAVIIFRVSRAQQNRRNNHSGVDATVQSDEMISGQVTTDPLTRPAGFVETTSRVSGERLASSENESPELNWGRLANEPVTASGLETAAGYSLPQLYINKADSADFERLPGLGPVLSARIVKYRELLGGFVRHGQLSEVYGLKDEVIEKLSPYLLVDSTNIRAININNATFRELLRHPYITKEQTESIMNYRSLAGPFTDVRELVVNRIFSPLEFERVSAYLVTTD